MSLNGPEFPTPNSSTLTGSPEPDSNFTWLLEPEALSLRLPLSVHAFDMGKRLPGSISTAYRRWSRDPSPSPTSPLERSPNGWKNRESDGVGLGIVVALDKFSSSELSPKVVVNFHRVLSPPIPIGSATPAAASRFDGEGCRGKRTRRCCNKDGFWEDGCGEMGIFYTSPPRSAAESSGFPVSGFLSSCHLCRKKLDGKDIYMYRGEKAFCSIDCRYRQIVADEYQESCGYAASRPSEISSPVDYSGQRLVHTGIMAA